MPRWSVVTLLLASVALVAVAAQPSGAGADGPLTVDEVAAELISQCGSGAILSEHYCGVARAMKATIQELIDEGKSKNEIVDYFVSEYGEGVLATPRKSGFSLTAWLTPFVGLAVGAAVISWAAWAWTRRRPLRSEKPIMMDKQKLDAYEEQVERELELLEQEAKQ
jgi:cytochrome c-type biogenesis protein CcmH